MTSTKYCQLTREANEVKWLEFSKQCLRVKEQFDVIFMDEFTVMMENHSKITFHCKWEQPRLKRRPKHPVKVHIWAGISERGPTRLMIFEGIMDAEFYVAEILTKGLLPFVRRLLLSTRQRPQTHQQSSQILHGRKQHQLVDYACGISRPEPDRTSLARAKALHTEHYKVPHQGRTHQRNHTILAGKTRKNIPDTSVICRVCCR